MFLWLAIGLGQAHEFVTWEVDPGGDWCAVVAQAASADLIVLAPGTYEGDCLITNGGRVDLNERTAIFGSAEGPSVIRGNVTIEADLVRLFRATLEGSVTVRGGGSSLDGLTFQNTDQGIVVEGDHAELVLSKNTFDGVGAPVAVCAGCVAGGVARQNWLLGPGTAGLRVEGDWLVGDNSVAGFTTGIEAVGEGTVSGNLVLDGQDGVVVDGTVAVHTNLVHRTTGAGIRADGAAEVLHNTVTPVSGAAIEGDTSGRVAANAVLGTAGPQDVGCTEACFADLAGDVLLPAVGGALVDAAEAGLVDDDFCGTEPVGAPDAGALEGAGGVPGVLSALPKADLCGAGWDPPGDTGVVEVHGPRSAPDPVRGRVTVQPGCGCQSASTVGPWGLVLLALARRRPG